MSWKVLFAPWRFKYVKRAEKNETEECVFCTSVNKGVGFVSLLLHKGTHASIILNKYPYNNGHTMVIPNRHTADFNELTPQEFTELNSLLKRAHNALQRGYEPQGMNIGMNLGRTGGAGIIDHMHYHLIPRWNGDTNFMPIVGGTKVISESLEETYKKLLPLVRD